MSIVTVGGWTFQHVKFQLPMRGRAPVVGADGIIAVAATHERWRTARVLMADMQNWGRAEGVSLTNGSDDAVTFVEDRFLRPAGIELGTTMIVQWDSLGAFDWYFPIERGWSPVVGLRHGSGVRSRSAVLSWWGHLGRRMMHVADSVGLRPATRGAEDGC
jgi:hypothetical protein